MAKCEFCGQDMLTAEGCVPAAVKCEDKVYDRVKVGDPGDFFENADESAVCGDCGAHYGHYHHPGCDCERCPVCGGQLISCDCKLEEPDESQAKQTFKIPVTWEVYGTVEVEADSIEEAIRIAHDDEGVIPLPTESNYVDGSWRVTEEDPDVVRELYN